MRRRYDIFVSLGVMAVVAVAAFIAFHAHNNSSMPERTLPERTLPEQAVSEQGATAIPQIEMPAAAPSETVQKAHDPSPLPGVMIAIIIDDVGVDLKRSRRAEQLPAAVTLAYLPYSPKLKEQTARASAAGHELMVHLPMQPEKAGVDPGPDYLGTDLPPEEVARRVDKNLNAFDGYAAVNNHMGSQFTQDRARLMILMTAIRARGAMFIDSRTAPQSIAEKMAREFGVAASHRDIFIDHVEDGAQVDAQLKKIEQTARKYGSAIAIGHPKDVTLGALEKWIPTLKARGFRLVPVTEAIKYRLSRKKAD